MDQRKAIVRDQFSYRRDPAVPSFDDTAPIIVFDGLCVLCSNGAQWMMARDPNGTSRFVSIQQPLPQALYQHYGLDAQRFETFMVLADGRPYLRWAGILAAARSMPQPWRLLGHAGRVVPDWMGDKLYDVLQRNRIRWFGGREVCFAPKAAQKSRFL